MSRHVVFDTTSVWEYYNEFESSIRDTPVLLAKNDESGVKIYLGSDGENPQFMVLVDDELSFQDFAINPEDCINTLNELYNEYLDMDFIHNAVLAEIESREDNYDENEDDDEEAHDDNECDDEVLQASEDISKVIKQRESSLYTAALDFVIEAMDGDEALEEADFWVKLQDCLEKMLKCVDEAGFDVYRPMFIKDEESGEVFFEEYPYKEYDIS